MVLALGGLLALLALSQAPAAEARTFTLAASAASERAGASASRTRIVHISTRRNAGIFTMGPRGNARHRLRRGLVDGVAVSANGRRMVFARSRPTPCGRCPADFFTEVLVAKGNGRKQRMIKKFRHAGVESVAISPNGRWIAISLFRGASADIYVMRYNGRSVKQLTKGRGFDTSPSFSPNGKRIAFSREGRGTHIFSIRRRGGGLRRLTRGPGFNRDPVYSPNGRLIAFSRSRGGNSAIFTMRSDGSRRHRVTSHRRGVEDIDPDFSPGGGSIVFARGVGTRFDLYTVRTSGRNERRAAHAGIGLIDPDWTRRP